MEHIVNQNLMVSFFKGFTTPAAHVLLWEKLQDIAQGKYRKAVSNLRLLIAQDKPEEAAHIKRQLTGFTLSPDRSCLMTHWLQLDKQHANSTLPLLVGSRGCGKSTYCMNILSPELRDYYTDSIDLSKRRDVEQALNQFALINMDEFDSIGPSYQGFLKHIILRSRTNRKFCDTR